MAEGLKSKTMRKTTRVAGIVIVLGLVASTAYLAFRYQQLHSQKAQLIQQLGSTTKELTAYKTDPNQASKAEVARLVAEVGKLYALPKDEDPSVATVKDKTKLTDQPFFAKAENGDVTLIYSNAKLAILYRASTKQIINVSSVTIQDQPTQTPTTP